jgi:N-acetylglucosamine-6-phosphate deacetylase
MFGDVECEDFDRYFDLWPEEDVEQFNKEYEVPVLAPGFVAFATNGGGELYVFDQNEQVSELPCIGMQPQYASLIATTWSEFEARIKKTGEQVETRNHH